MMKEKIYYPKLLKEKCSECNSFLYTYYDPPTKDIAGAWIITCNNDACDFESNERFPNIVDLQTVYKIDNRYTADYDDATKVMIKTVDDDICGKTIKAFYQQEDEEENIILFTDGSCLRITNSLGTFFHYFPNLDMLRNSTWLNLEIVEKLEKL